MILGYRSNDAVITICQNNRTKSIEISEINPHAAEVLGYKPAELVRKPITHILPPRIAELLTEYVEFADDANDVGAVLSKVQSFSVMGHDGKERGFRLKVVRAESNDGAFVFRLVLQDKVGLRKNEALRKVIQDNFKGHEVIDRDTGLPDRNSLAKDIELMGYYNNKSDLRSNFGVLQLDHYDELFSQYGRQACQAMMHHLAMMSRQNLRPDDVVGSLGYKRLGVLMLDTNQETARMVCNRLRWQIAANPFHLPDKSTLGLSVSTSFAAVIGGMGDKNLIDDCEAALDAQGPDVVNALIEVAVSDRRKAVDNQ